MALPRGYKSVTGTDHAHPKDHKVLQPTDGEKLVTATMIVRRRPGGPKLRGVGDFAAKPRSPRKHLSREEFAASHGADPKELNTWRSSPNRKVCK